MLLPLCRRKRPPKALALVFGNAHALNLRSLVRPLLVDSGKVVSFSPLTVASRVLWFSMHW
jgi:hypothetical protein